MLLTGWMRSWSFGGPRVGHRNAELELGGPRVGRPRVGRPGVGRPRGKTVGVHNAILAQCWRRTAGWVEKGRAGATTVARL